MNGRLQFGRSVAVLGGLLALTAVLLAVASAQASNSSLKFVFRGTAWGAFVKSGNVAQLQPAFKATLWPCSARAGSVARNGGASAHLSGVVRTGTISNRVSTTSTSSSGSTRSSSIVHSTSLLSGLVRANAVTTSARASFVAGKGFVFGHGVKYVGLTVAGNTVKVRVDKKVSLPGIGYVVFDQQTRSIHNGMALLSVNAIHVVVTKPGNALGLKTGTNVIIGHAVAGVTRPTRGGPVRGYAYGTHAQAGNVAESGYSARLFMSCVGGSQTIQIAEAKASNLAASRTVQSHVASSLQPSLTTGHASNTVHNVNLVKGAVRADAVRAAVHGTFNGRTHRFTDTSAITNLIVNGNKVIAKANLRLQVKGVGTLWVHRVLRTPRGITVRMLELIAGAGNTMGIKTGTDIQVGVAHVKFLF